jgi:hypothetical protein
MPLLEDLGIQELPYRIINGAGRVKKPSSPSLSSSTRRARYLRNEARFSRVSNVYFSGQESFGRFAFLLPGFTPAPGRFPPHLDCFRVAPRVKKHASLRNKTKDPDLTLW